MGYNRMNFRWGNVGTFQISPGSHMWQVFTEHYKEERIPITDELRRAARVHHDGRRGFDYVICEGLRRGRGGGAIPGHAGAHGQGEDRRRLRRWLTPGVRARGLHRAARQAVRDRRKPRLRACRAKTFFPPRNGRATWARRTRRRPSTSPRSRCASPNRSRSSSRSACTCSTTRTSDTTIREAAIFELCERLQPGIHPGRAHPLLHDRLGRLRHPGEEAQQDRGGLAAQFPLRDPLLLRRACGSRSRSARDTDIYSMDDNHVVSHDAGEPRGRHPQSDPGRTRARRSCRPNA